MWDFHKIFHFCLFYTPSARRSASILIIYTDSRQRVSIVLASQVCEFRRLLPSFTRSLSGRTSALVPVLLLCGSRAETNAPGSSEHDALSRFLLCHLTAISDVIDCSTALSSVQSVVHRKQRNLIVFILIQISSITFVFRQTLLLIILLFLNVTVCLSVFCLN